MARQLLTDELWETVRLCLPPRPLRPRGGRPPISDRDALTGILFVLKTGIPWEDLPHEMGCGCGMTCLRRLQEWQRAGAWPRIRGSLEAGLRHAHRINWARADGEDGRTDPGRRLSADRELPPHTFIDLGRRELDGGRRFPVGS